MVASDIFEQDWPGTPLYNDFADAYEAIGSIRQAANLRRVAASFPFSEPHLHKEKREAFIDARYDKSTYCVPEWGNALCGDKEVWERLAAFYARCKKDFPVLSVTQTMVEILVTGEPIHS